MYNILYDLIFLIVNLHKSYTFTSTIQYIYIYINNLPRNLYYSSYYSYSFIQTIFFCGINTHLNRLHFGSILSNNPIHETTNWIKFQWIILPVILSIFFLYFSIDVVFVLYTDTEHKLITNWVISIKTAFLSN